MKNAFEKLREIKLAYLHNMIPDNQRTRNIKEEFLTGCITLEEAITKAKGDE